jgi:hypothetical protein
LGELVEMDEFDAKPETRNMKSEAAKSEYSAQARTDKSDSKSDIQITCGFRI